MRYYFSFVCIFLCFLFFTAELVQAQIIDEYDPSGITENENNTDNSQTPNEENNTVNELKSTGEAASEAIEDWSVGKKGEIIMGLFEMLGASDVVTPFIRRFAGFDATIFGAYNQATSTTSVNAVFEYALPKRTGPLAAYLRLIGDFSGSRLGGLTSMYFVGVKYALIAKTEDPKGAMFLTPFVQFGLNSPTPLGSYDSDDMDFDFAGGINFWYSFSKKFGLITRAGVEYFLNSNGPPDNYIHIFFGVSVYANFDTFVLRLGWEFAHLEWDGVSDVGAYQHYYLLLTLLKGFLLEIGHGVADYPDTYIKLGLFFSL